MCNFTSVLVLCISSLMLILNCRYSAQVALDRRDEMDVEGWNVGDPYVPLYSVIEKRVLALLTTTL